MTQATEVRFLNNYFVAQIPVTIFLRKFPTPDTTAVETF